MTDDELIADFFETRPAAEEIELFVCKVSGNGPYIRWTPARKNRQK